MEVTKEGTKQECFDLVDKIKHMGYEIVSYSLAPINPDHPEGEWTITVTFRNKEYKNEQ